VGFTWRAHAAWTVMVLSSDANGLYGCRPGYVRAGQSGAAAGRPRRYFMVQMPVGLIGSQVFQLKFDYQTALELFLQEDNGTIGVHVDLVIFSPFVLRSSDGTIATSTRRPAEPRSHP
jgi:hypothetical protein